MVLGRQWGREAEREEALHLHCRAEVLLTEAADPDLTRKAKTWSRNKENEPPDPRPLPVTREDRRPPVG